jgi:hypothetical protein
MRDFNCARIGARKTNDGLNHELEDEDVVQIVTKTVKQQQNDRNYGSLVQTVRHYNALMWISCDCCGSQLTFCVYFLLLQFADKHAKKRLEAKKHKQARLRG